MLNDMEELLGGDAGSTRIRWCMIVYWCTLFRFILGVCRRRKVDTRTRPGSQVRINVY